MTQDHIAFARKQTRRIRFVTSQLAWGFPGLTRAPYGFMLLFPYLLVPILRILGSSIWIVVVAIVVVGAGCILASLDLRRYYARRFGRILSDARKSSSARSLLLPALFIASQVYLYLAQVLKPPFYPAGLLFALYYLYSWFTSDGLRFHRGIAAALAASLSLSPFWGLITKPTAADLMLGLLALELIFGGLCDHILLVRSFRALQAETHEHAVPRSC